MNLASQQGPVEDAKGPLDERLLPLLLTLVLSELENEVEVDLLGVNVQDEEFIQALDEVEDRALFREELVCAEALQAFGGLRRAEDHLEQLQDNLAEFLVDYLAYQAVSVVCGSTGGIRAGL